MQTSGSYSVSNELLLEGAEQDGIIGSGFTWGVLGWGGGEYSLPWYSRAVRGRLGNPCTMSFHTDNDYHHHNLNKSNTIGCLPYAKLHLHIGFQMC
jgi:hypothetical protein